MEQEQPQLVEEIDYDSLESVPAPDSSWQRLIEHAQDLREHLRSKLTDRERYVLRQYYSDGFAHREIAANYAGEHSLAPTKAQREQQINAVALEKLFSVVRAYYTETDKVGRKSPRFTEVNQRIMEAAKDPAVAEFLRSILS